MMVNLNLTGKTIVIVGAGEQAEKRINAILDKNCKITVVSNTVNPGIAGLAKGKKISLINHLLTDPKFLSKLEPDLVIAATSSKKTNQKILKYAKQNRIMAYSSDHPDESDFSNPAVIDFDGMVQIAIFTGGKSPIISRRIKQRTQKVLKDIITKEEIAQIRIQSISRALAKKTIPAQKQRREYLHSVAGDDTIAQLIKDGHIAKAEKRAKAMLRGWC